MRITPVAGIALLTVVAAVSVATIVLLRPVTPTDDPGRETETVREQPSQPTAPQELREPQDRPEPDDRAAPETVAMREVTDDAVRRRLRFRERGPLGSARLTLDGRLVRDVMQNGSTPEARLLHALLDALLDDDASAFTSLVETSAREYLPDELRWQLMSGENGDAGTAVTAAYLLESGVLPEQQENILQYVLLYRDRAVELTMYLEGGLVVDGELVVHPWGPDRSLAQESIDAPLPF